jgi:hypothetical protein
VRKINLKKNMRVHLRDESAQISSNKLLEIGEGRLVVHSSGNIKLPSDFFNLVSSVAELMEAVYPAVYFTTESAPTVVDQPPNTTLTAYFQLCQQDGFARTLLYPEIPRYYTSRKISCRRKIGQPVLGHDAVASDALDRVYTVHPSNAECYFLGMLLHLRRGPRSSRN